MGVRVHVVSTFAPAEQSDDWQWHKFRQGRYELLPIIETQCETIDTDSESDNDGDDEQE